MPLQKGQPIEPQVTIIQREDARIEEFRIQGRMYMVRVTPVAGPAYYLLDEDGDGSLESMVDDLHVQPPLPQWVLFSW